MRVGNKIMNVQDCQNGGEKRATHKMLEARYIAT